MKRDKRGHGARAEQRDRLTRGRGRKAHEALSADEASGVKDVRDTRGSTARTRPCEAAEDGEERTLERAADTAEPELTRTRSRDML
jgi:hypothetical protein